MSITRLFTDECYVIDKSGVRNGPFKTRFTSNDYVMVVHTDAFGVEVGEELVQLLPNKKELKFVVTDFSYQKGLSRQPDFWRVTFSRKTLPSVEAPAVNPTYHFHGSNNVQIGDNNIQNIRSAVETLVHGINNAQTTPQEKEKAKGLLRTFLENPTTASVLGAAATGVLALLG